MCITEQEVKSYMEMEHEKILSWEHLKINLETGIGKSKIDYVLAEKIYYDIVSKPK